MRSRLLPLFLIFVFAAPASFAQSTFGTIVGIIKDPGEGFVTGAQIALTNLDDNSIRSASADDNGTFQFTNLKPGKYQLTVQANGFSEYQAASVELEARQSLRLDLTLKLASSSQTVEVTGDSGPLINTESATLGDTKNSQQLTGLPVNYRGATTSPLAMLSTFPGAQQDANGNVSIGGRLPSQIQYSVDGASTVNIRQNGALGNMNLSENFASRNSTTMPNSRNWATSPSPPRTVPSNFTAAFSSTRRIAPWMPKSGTPATNLTRFSIPSVAVLAARSPFPNGSMVNPKLSSSPITKAIAAATPLPSS
jgi:hypothetical protein